MTAQPIHQNQPAPAPAPVQAVPAAPAVTFIKIDANDPLPAFEGHAVASSRVKVMGFADIGIDNAALRVDDVVRISVEVRVTGVRHEVDEKSGDLVRYHTLKPLQVELLPFDPTDPNDTGILRP